MLTDKFIIMLTASQTGLMTAIMADIRRTREHGELTPEEKEAKIAESRDTMVCINKIFEEIKAEVEALEDYIQSDTKSILTQMNHKLEEVLLGPYYQAGKELMENSKEDFSKRENNCKEI